MTESAARRALALPEIVDLIVDKGARRRRISKRRWERIWGDEDGYVNYALVSRAWVEPVLNAIWESRRGSYSLAPRAEMSALPESREQYYANKIRDLDVDWKFINDVAQLNVKFNNLRKLSFSHQDQHADVPLDNWAPKLLHERLETLEFWSSKYCDAAALETIRLKCPRLRELTIWVRHALLDNLIAALTGLETFECQSQYVFANPEDEPADIRMPDQSLLFSQLAQCRSIKRISLKEIVPLNDTSMVSDNAGTELHFRKLKKLQGKTDVISIPRIVSQINNSTMRTLRLTVRFNPNVSPEYSAFIVHLAKLHQLEELSISLEEGITLPVEEIKVLGSFSNLEILRLDSVNSYEDLETGLSCPSTNLPALGDAMLTEISRNWRGIDRLHLGVRHTMTAASLITLGKACPGLERLHIAGIFDIKLLEDEPENLFPVMVGLHLGRVVYGSHAATESDEIGRVVMEVLFRCAPRCRPRSQAAISFGDKDTRFVKRMYFFMREGYDRGLIEEEEWLEEQEEDH